MLPTLGAPNPTLELQKRNCHLGKGRVLHLWSPSLLVADVRIAVVLSEGHAEATPQAHLVTLRGITPTPVLQIEAWGRKRLFSVRQE